MQTGAWHGHGRSEADWLAKQSGVSHGRARSILDAADKLGAVPEVEAAARNGELSEAQVREIAPAAAADPSATNQLLDSARNEAFGKTKEKCARVRNAAAGDDAARHQRIKDNRFLRIWQDQFGAGRLEASGAPEVIARFRAALEPFRERAFKQARAEGRKERPEAYAFDALELWLNEQAGHVCGGAPKRRRRQRTPDAEAILLIDIGALKRGHTEPGESCEIAGLGPVPVQSARELMGDALLRIVLKGGVDIRTVTHSKRTINEVLQTALLASGWACDNPECPNRHRLERDHLEAVALGGVTALFNLRPKCKGGCHQDKTRDDMTKLRERRRPPPKAAAA